MTINNFVHLEYHLFWWLMVIPQAKDLLVNPHIRTVVEMECTVIQQKGLPKEEGDFLVQRLPPPPGRRFPSVTEVGTTLRSHHHAHINQSQAILIGGCPCVVGNATTLGGEHPPKE